MQNKRNDRITKLIYIVGIISALIFLYAGVRLLGYYREYRAETALEQELAKIREAATARTGDGSGQDESGSTAGSDEADEAAEEDARAARRKELYEVLKAENADYVCWLSIADTEIDYPVVQRDNSFYLSHDFSGRKNSHGAVFVDENCQVGDEVILLHGHHMKDGTMFAELKNYKKEEFCVQHKDITLEFETEEKTYQVFAVVKVDLTDADSFAFEKLPQTEKEKSDYLDGLITAAFWLSGDKVTTSDDILLLSTCDYDTDDERLIIAARASL